MKHTCFAGVKRALLFLPLFVLVPTRTFAIPGESAVIAMEIKLQTAMQKIEYGLMNANIVKTAKTMYDNYMQTKMYVDMIREASQHRGGLMGYYMDVFESRLNADAHNQYSHLKSWATTVSDDNDVKRLVEGAEKFVDSKIDKTADKWINEGEKNLSEAVDWTNKRTEALTKTTDQLRKLADKANRLDMPEKERESISLQAQILTAEILLGLAQTENAKFSNEVKQMKLEHKAALRNRAVARDMNRFVRNQIKNQTKGQTRSGPLTENQIIKSLQELPE